MEDKEFHKLIEKIYAASLDPAQWTECVNLLSAAFGNRIAGLYIFDSETGTMGSLIATGIEAEFEESLLQHFAPLNPYPRLIHDFIPTGIAITDAQVISRDSVRKGEFYNDWVRPQRLDVYQVGAKIAQDAKRYAMIVTQPDPADFEELEATYVERMRQLIPHFSNALRINRMLEGNANAAQSLANAFDRSQIAVFVLDQQKRIGLANRNAEDILAGNDVLRTNAAQGLVAVESGCASLFSDAVDACIHPQAAKSTGPILLKSYRSGARHIAWVQSVANPSSQFASETIKLFGLMGPEPAVVVLVSKIEQDAPLRADLVSAIFHLTPAEGKLAAALAGGESLSDYASAAGVSRNTVRAQLTSIFEKTATNRQAELVAAIWRGVGLFPSD